MLTLNFWIIVSEWNLISALLPLKLQTYQYMLQLVRFFHSKGKVTKQRIQMFTQHLECIIWESLSFYSQAVHFHRCETVKSGTDSECYNPLCFIKHNCHCQKWQNVWVRGDPHECVPRLACVCEGNSLVPSLSPCLCAVRVCWSYRVLCRRTLFLCQSSGTMQPSSTRPEDLATCMCVYAHAHICTVHLWVCGCLCEYHTHFS